MEPDAKRIRLWRSERPTHSHGQVHKPQQWSAPSLHDAEQALLPTRTINLSDFRRRAFHAYRFGQEGSNLNEKGGTMYLMPRAPVDTVTAKVIDVALVNGIESTPLTQITEPTSDTVLNIVSIGSLTILGPRTNTLTSTTESSNPSSTDTSRTFSGSTTSFSSSIARNGTTVSAGANVVTITNTSILNVSFQNGTLVVPSQTTTTGSSASTQVRLMGIGGSDEGADATLTQDGAGGNGPVVQTSNAANGGVVPATGTRPAPQATATDSGGGGVTLTPQQQQVVGGVVGGVAGVALVLVALLYLLKWYRQRLKRVGRLPEQLAASDQNNDYDDDDDGTVSRPDMVQTNRSSVGPIAAVASRLRQLHPQSTNTVSTSSNRDSLPAGTRERSFQRVAGRKIPPVLSAGGDGYGGGYGVFGPLGPEPNDSQISMYHDDFVHNRPFNHQSMAMSGPTTPTRTNPFIDPPSAGRESYRSPRPFSPTTNFSRPTASRDSGVQDQRSPSALDYRPQFAPVGATGHGYAALRPSPARTPVTQSPMSSTVHLPQPSSTPPLMAGHVPNLPTIPNLDLPPRGKSDREGRSFGSDAASASRLAMRSGSGVSGRTSSTGGRFKEDI